MKLISTKNILVYIILIVVGAIFAFPFIWMLLTSLKSADGAIFIPPRWFPEHWQWGNYLKLFAKQPFGYFYANTILLVLFRIVCALIFSTMAGYAFARIPFPGRKFMFALVVIQFMIPGVIFVYPQYKMLLSMGMLNTMFALVFPGLVSAFGTFLMRQGSLVLPASLEDASVMDGCNRWQVYVFVYLPLLKASMLALSIFTMIGAWKDLMWPLVVNDDVKKMTITAGIMFLQSDVHIQHYGIMMAGASVAVVPLLLFYFLFQRHFHSGIQITGNK